MPSPLPDQGIDGGPGATRSAWRPDIQGLRAVAVGVVVAFHAGLPLPGGFVGVDIFFVISGFVITGMLNREWAASGRIRLGHFYLRRFKRLTPALALMVSAVVVLSAVVLSPLGPQQNAAKTGIGAMLLVANFVIERISGGYFDAPAATNPLLNTWSLSVEEQFYLAFPAVLILGWWVARRARMLRWSAPVIVGLVAAGSFALAAVGASGLAFRGSDIVLGFYSPFTRAWEFAVGALLALALTDRRIRSRSVAAALGVVGAAMLAASLWLITGTTPFPGPWTLLPVVGTLLLLASGTQATAPTTRLLSTRPFVAVGDWSYSIYLWHWPFIVFAGVLWTGSRAAAILAAALSFAPALASYRWLERPIRQLRALGRPRTALLVAVTVAVPVGLSAALWFAAQNGFWSPAVRDFQAAVLPFHAGHNAGCESGATPAERTSAACTWNATGSGAPIYLLGDSNADQFIEGVVAAAEQSDRPVIESTLTSCPFIALDWRVPGTDLPDRESCTSFVQRESAYLSTAPAGLVILAASDTYWRDPAVALATPGQPASNDTAAKLAAVESGLVATVRDLQASGHQVLLVRPIPKWIAPHGWDPQRCTSFSITAGTCRQDMTIEQGLQQQQGVRDVYERAAASTGAGLLDTWTVLCAEDTCSTQGPDFVRYRDESHISVPQSMAFADAFRAAFAGSAT